MISLIGWGLADAYLSSLLNIVELMGFVHIDKYRDPFTWYYLQFRFKLSCDKNNSMRVSIVYSSTNIPTQT